jgi:hypothetical protein
MNLDLRDAMGSRNSGFQDIECAAECFAFEPLLHGEVLVHVDRYGLWSELQLVRRALVVLLFPWQGLLRI